MLGIYQPIFIVVFIYLCILYIINKNISNLGDEKI